MKERILKTLKFLSLAIVLAFAFPVAAQQAGIVVKGQVVGDEGEPLAGVTVISSDGKAGTATDVDGNYVLRLTAPTTLTFSYIGYETEKVKVTKSGTRNVEMSSSNLMLDDVVVVGYGTQKKINLTGSVQSVSSDEIIRRSVSTGSAALQGIVPGLSAVVSSGQPGNDQASLKLRGQGSLNSSTSPLILIDGIEGDMNRIDLNTVESITVLKDAASVSIYGSRASNGVILVTTKRGKEGKVNVSFNGYAGVNMPTTLPKPVGAVQYMQAVDAARVNNHQDPQYTDMIALYQNGGVDNMTYFDTDWLGSVLKDYAWTQNYSVSVSGGNDRAKVYASAGYYKQEGMIENNEFSRMSLRVNTDTKVNDWLRVGADVSVRQANALSPAMASASTIIGYAMTFSPLLPGINADGTYGKGNDSALNPIALTRNGGRNKSTAPEYIVRATVNIDPFEGLNIFGAYSWKRNDAETSAFQTPYDYYENGELIGSYPSTGSSGSEQWGVTVAKQFNLQGTYEKTFNKKHYFKAMLGFQSEQLDYHWITTGRSGYNYEGYEDLVHGDASTATNSSNRYAWAMLSYFYRFNYIYDNRYLFEVNGRYDGTSRFKAGNRWGFFPSFSAGWRISEEEFYEPVKDVVNEMKLRASYGELGNQAISGYYPYSASISSSTAYGYWFDEEFSPGVAQTQLANEQISWEKSRQVDVGVDLAFFNNRFLVTGDYYIRYIDDMLQQFPVPLFVSMTSPWQNAGSMRNNGWELSLTWQDRVGDFSYYIRGNLSDVKNTVTNLYGKEYVGTTITREGDPYGSWYGYVADGLFQSREEIESTPVYGGNKDNVEPGYIKYVDIDDDGDIDGDDRTIIGNPSPRYEFGLTVGGEWKGLDFSVFFQGVGKKDVYYSGGGARPLSGNSTIYEHQFDWWSEDNRDAKYPILLQDPTGANQNNIISSFWVKSGAYCRLKNVVVGYTLPKEWVEKAMLSKVRIYASAQNALTIRNNFYKGFDPEISSGGASMYPLNMSFLFGLNVEF
ncbi:MAG TPA: TonB-dependent receptor [Candidatus Limisoma gallistercoris]|nr:TonB-dependent receptor [Candidatus Limisoma gallistercoris]